MRGVDEVEVWTEPRSLVALDYVVQFSGGIGSWAAARRVVDEVGRDRVTLLFADTKIEDEDLYRFLNEASDDLGVPITRIADGRTPWEVFEDRRYIGNTRADPCSLVLKRGMLWRWMETYCNPDSTTVVFGIDWTEEHRMVRLMQRHVDEGTGWQFWAPLCDEPLYAKGHWLDRLRERGIDPPRLYDLGFPHNNCGGFCVKAGHAHFKLLLEQFPERFRHHEEEEQRMRELLDKDVAILRDRRGGTTDPLPLADFRQRLIEEGDLDESERYDWGGCGCALSDDLEEVPL